MKIALCLGEEGLAPNYILLVFGQSNSRRCAFFELARKANRARLGNLEKLFVYGNFLSSRCPIPIGFQSLVLDFQLDQKHIQSRLIAREPCVFDIEAPTVDASIAQERQEPADFELAQLVGVEDILIDRERSVRQAVRAVNLASQGSDRLAGAHLRVSARESSRDAVISFAFKDKVERAVCCQLVGPGRGSSLEAFKDAWEGEG